jgi:ATP-dependent DNA helicase RecQ
MKGEALARIVLPREPRAGPPSKRRGRAERPEPPALAGGERDLYDRLRARRAEIAKEDGLPAYVIAHDRTLVEMARLRPQSRAGLLEVHGMGPSRVERYGERFLGILTGD